MMYVKVTALDVRCITLAGLLLMSVTSVSPLLTPIISVIRSLERITSGGLVLRCIMLRNVGEPDIK